MNIEHDDMLRKQLELTEIRLRGAEEEIRRIQRENSLLRIALSKNSGIAPSKVLNLRLIKGKIGA